MRQIPIKQLYKTLPAELKNLPFEITVKGVPVAVVSGLDLKAYKPVEKKAGLDRTKKEHIAELKRRVEVQSEYHQYRPMPKSKQASGDYDR